MAQNRNHRRKPMSQINVVPYIDVMLVLLVIFMVTAPLFHQGVEVQLPQAPSDPIEELMKDQEPLIVSVDKVGNVYVNKASNPSQAVPMEEFSQIIQGILSQESGLSTYVKGDTDVDYGKVVKVMVALQSAGVADVGLITQPEPGQNN